MSKRLTSFLVGALAVVLFGSTANAQVTKEELRQKMLTSVSVKGDIKSKQAIKGPAAAKTYGQAKFKKDAPQKVGKVVPLRPTPINVGRAKFRPVSQAPKLPASMPDFYANMIWDNGNSPMSVVLMNSSDFSYETVLESGFDGSYGGGIQDGIYFGGELFWGAYPFINYFNIESGEGSYWMPYDFSLTGYYDSATSQDGYVYGAFLNADGNDIEWAKVDYASGERIAIGTASFVPMATGITSDNTIYAIDGNGILWKVNSTTGEETQIGDTELPSSYLCTGEIDPKTNVFYYIPSFDANAEVYAIDLATAEATFIADLGDVEFVDMAFVAPECEDAAPAAPQNVKLNFSDGGQNGTISFVMPTETFAGDPLTDPTLHFTVTIDGVVYAEGDAAPGAGVNADLTNVPEGMQKFVIRAANTVGEGATIKIKKWIGFDQPKAPTNVVLEIDEEGNATVTWDAPTEGVHDGWLGLITYNVYRKQAGVYSWVSELQTPTTFTEKLDVTTLTAITYYVQAVNYNNNSGISYMLDQLNGGWAPSNTEAFGSAFDTPKCFDFADDADAALFVVDDANGDERTWTFDGYGSAVYPYDVDNDADDWLIAPPVKVKAGNYYVVKFMASCMSSAYPERFEVYAGYGNTAADMIQQILEPTDIVNTVDEEYEVEFIATQDGELNIGFHAISDANMWNIYISGLCIENGPSLEAPDAPVLTVVPAPKGALAATATIDAPTKKINGEPLEAIDHIDLLRDGVVINTFTNVTPGAKLNYDDEVPASAFYTYQAIPYENATDRGKRSNKVTVFIGLDDPVAVENVMLQDGVDKGYVKISWDEPGEVGINGGYYDPTAITNYIWQYVRGNWEADVDSVKGFNRVFHKFDTTTGEQDIYGVAVWSGNEYALNNQPLVIGAPYELPYVETFDGNNNLFFTYDASDYENIEPMNYSEGVDDNNSFAFVSSVPSAWAAVETGKISLKNSTAPVMCFYYQVANTDAPVKVGIYTMDGLQDEYEFEPEEADEWQEAAVDLHKYAGWTYIRARIEFQMEDGEYAIVDNINIFDALDDNLAVTNLEAPKSVKPNQVAPISFQVKNFGQNPAADFQVIVTIDGEVALDSIVSDTLDVLEIAKFNLEYATDIFTEPGDKEVNVQVNYIDDLNEADDVANAIITVVAPNVPTVSNLTAKTTGDVTNAKWEAPAETAPEAAVEGFDDTNIFPTWSFGGIDTEVHEGALGDWTLYNGNTADSNIGFSSLDYEGKYAVGAWQVFDVVQAGADFIEPLSGDVVLASFTAGADENTDHWLISPEQPGVAQTLTFGYLSVSADYIETIEVLASSTDNKVESFTKLAEFTTFDDQWQNAAVDLPEGTKYFAIRHTSKFFNFSGGAGAAVFIDNVSYLGGPAAIAGYNVYVDGELYDTTTDLKQAINGISTGTHIVSVTVVYANGVESAPVSVEVVEGVSTAIELIEAIGRPVDIYTVDGKLVRRQATDVKGLKAGLYIINGMKAIVK